MALFLGAGVNLCARSPDEFHPLESLPSGGELARHLLARLELPQDEDRERDPQLEGALNGDLLRASEYALLKCERRKVYHELHRISDGNFPPTPVHRLVADLPRLSGHHQYVVTTNYDDVMERAFGGADERFDEVWYHTGPGGKPGGSMHLHLGDGQRYPTDPTEARPSHCCVRHIDSPNKYMDFPFLDRSIIFKVHGEVWRGQFEPRADPEELEHDSYVIAEDDDIDYLAFMSELPLRLVSELKRRHLLFLIWIREEWLGRMDFFKGSIPRLFERRLEIKRLDRISASKAIEEPVARYNRRARAAGGATITLGDGLVQAVLNDVARGQIASDHAGQGGAEARPDEAQEYAAPYLQLVMRRLWETEAKQDSAVVRKQTLNDALGGAKSIVLQHVNSVMAGLTHRQQRVAAVVFHCLVTPSGTKVAYSAHDLRARAGPDELSIREAEYEDLLEEMVSCGYGIWPGAIERGLPTTSSGMAAE